MKHYLLLMAIVCLISNTLVSQQEKIDQLDLSGTLNGSFDYKFVEDDNGTIYAIHTFVGAGLITELISFDGEAWTKEDFPCQTCLRDLAIGPDGQTLYAAADTEGIFKKSTDGSWENITTTPAIKLTIISENEIKFVNTDGVYNMLAGNVTEGNNTNKPNFFTLSGFELDMDGQLWMLKSNELYIHTETTGWTKTTDSPSPELIEYAPDGKLWLAENTGALSFYGPDGYKFNQIKNVFPSGVSATAFHIDTDNTFWVGIQGNTPGLTKYSENETVKYSSESLLGSSNPINYIFTTKDGEVWVLENYNNTIAHIYMTDGTEPVDLDQDGFNAEVDCDDNNAAINPDAEEIPNNDIDENCDGEILTIDVDQDGFNSDVDCDDNNAAINPDAEEIPNNDIDENCDGETLSIDLDQDGFNSDEDCDDNNAAINPSAEEVPNNDIDENCDGEALTIDVDQDGFNSDEDCDDNNAAINPDAEEIPNNDIDENCDGEALSIDIDQDGFNSDVDCDDNNAAINPDAEDIPDNGIDENCDGMDLITSSLEVIDYIKINISPNPSQGNSRISFSETLQNPQISILSFEGRLVQQFDCTRPILYFDINTSNFAPGVYIVNVLSRNKLISEKLIVE